MRLRSWLKMALRTLWQPTAGTKVIPPWSERELTPEDYFRFEDAQWGRAIRAMGERMAPRWAVYR